MASPGTPLHPDHPASMEQNTSLQQVTRQRGKGENTATFRSPRPQEVYNAAVSQLNDSSKAKMLWMNRVGSPPNGKRTSGASLNPLPPQPPSPSGVRGPAVALNLAGPLNHGLSQHGTKGEGSMHRATRLSENGGLHEPLSAPRRVTSAPEGQSRPVHQSMATSPPEKYVSCCEPVDRLGEGPTSSYWLPHGSNLKTIRTFSPRETDLESLGSNDSAENSPVDPAGCRHVRLLGDPGPLLLRPGSRRASHTNLPDHPQHFELPHTIHRSESCVEAHIMARTTGSHGHFGPGTTLDSAVGEGPRPRPPGLHGRLSGSGNSPPAQESSPLTDSPLLTTPRFRRRSYILPGMKGAQSQGGDRPGGGPGTSHPVPSVPTSGRSSPNNVPQGALTEEHSGGGVPNSGLSSPWSDRDPSSCPSSARLTTKAVQKMMDAVRSKDIQHLEKVLQQLAVAGSEVAGLNDLHPITQRTPLHEAVMLNNLTMVHMLLAAGSSPAVGHPTQGPPLLHAAAWGETDMLQVLLSHGASLDVVDVAGYTALHYACSGGHVEAARLLIRRGASIRARTCNGEAPLDLAKPEMVRALFEPIDIHRNPGAGLTSPMRMTAPLSPWRAQEIQMMHRHAERPSQDGIAPPSRLHRRTSTEDGLDSVHLNGDTSDEHLGAPAAPPLLHLPAPKARRKLVLTNLPPLGPEDILTAFKEEDEELVKKSAEQLAAIGPRETQHVTAHGQGRSSGPLGAVYCKEPCVSGCTTHVEVQAEGRSGIDNHHSEGLLTMGLGCRGYNFGIPCASPVPKGPLNTPVKVVPDTPLMSTQLDVCGASPIRVPWVPKFRFGTEGSRLNSPFSPELAVEKSLKRHSLVGKPDEVRARSDVPGLGTPASAPGDPSPKPSTTQYPTCSLNAEGPATGTGSAQVRQFDRAGYPPEGPPPLVIHPPTFHHVRPPGTAMETGTAAISYLNGMVHTPGVKPSAQPQFEARPDLEPQTPLALEASPGSPSSPSRRPDSSPDICPSGQQKATPPLLLDDSPRHSMSPTPCPEARRDETCISQAATALTELTGNTGMSTEALQVRAVKMFTASVDYKSGDISWTRGELLGEGAYGKVYAGLNQVTGELMAVKVIELVVKGLDGKPRQPLHELKHELEMYKKLKHQNIVGYIDAQYEKDENALYIFLEYVPGGSIASMLDRFGRFREDLCRNYTRQLLLGLEYLHGRRVVHRDLKGGNVLVTRDGIIKLADFGASKVTKEATLTDGMKSLRGSVFWMAPEVIKGTGYGRRADIWSVGCTVIEMLTGKHPWPDLDNPWSAMFQIAKNLEGPPRPDGISDMCREFLDACLQYEPQNRPTCSELLQYPFVAGKGAVLREDKLGKDLNHSF